MTKKDYVAIASVLGSGLFKLSDASYTDRINLINDMITYFESDNPKFDSVAFRRVIKESANQ